MYLYTNGHHKRTMSLDICALSIRNNTNFSNQQWQSLPKYRPAWTVCSQHSYYHHSGPLHDTLQQTASHASRWQNLRFKVELAMIAQKGSRIIAILFL